ncbi:MAG: hypothetical protein ACLFUE_02730 [Desulfobacteraceae bacterium]
MRKSERSRNPFEDENIPDLSDPEQEEDRSEDENEPDSGPAEEATPRGAPGAGARRGLLLIGIPALIILASGAGVFLWLHPSVNLPWEKPGPGRRLPGWESITGLDSNFALQEQELAPFFLPLPRGGEKTIARLCLSVVWDKRASMRFQEVRTEARDMIFRRVSELAAESEDISEDDVRVCSAARRALQEVVRPDELQVLVKGVVLL